MLTASMRLGVPLVVLGTAACASAPPPAYHSVDRPVLTVPPAREQPAAEPAPARPVKVAGEAARWEGHYTCAQGITALTLHLTRNGERALEALFLFRAAKENPDVPSGSYTLAGEIEPDGSFELTPLQWIEQPDGYIMVGMAGRLQPGEDVLSGRITQSGCGDFLVRRAGAKQDLTK